MIAASPRDASTRADASCAMHSVRQAIANIHFSSVNLCGSLWNSVSDKTILATTMSPARKRTTACFAALDWHRVLRYGFMVITEKRLSHRAHREFNSDCKFPQGCGNTAAGMGFYPIPSSPHSLPVAAGQHRYPFAHSCPVSAAPATAGLSRPQHQTVEPFGRDGKSKRETRRPPSFHSSYCQNEF